MMKHTVPAIAAIVLLVVTLLVLPTTAAAQSRAVARSVAATSTAKWGAVAAPLGAAPVAGSPLTVGTRAFTELSQDFDVVNVGNSPLTGHTFSITTQPGFAGPQNPRVTLIVCPTGAWNQVGKCKGGEVSLGTTTSGNFTSSVPLAPGGRYSVNISTPWYWGAFSSTINVSVSREHARAATVTNN